MPLIPGAWYAFVTITYIANAKIGFNIPWNRRLYHRCLRAAVYVGVIIWYANKRRALKKKM